MMAGVAGCSAGAGGPERFDAMSSEEHLACAVDISAYTYLAAEGRVAADAAMLAQAGLALGWHHNAYAIPEGKGERADLINKERAAVMASDKPEAIAERASACIASAVARSAAG
ncbi:hypothetical protein ACLBKU_17210 [Erythrobacter sp. NE805]|uniref:hypothetical protein n=1 Tax=Erythrobacter sp. NE805 TaxID=3389875 RepID=UPI00396B0393